MYLSFLYQALKDLNCHLVVLVLTQILYMEIEDKSCYFQILWISINSLLIVCCWLTGCM